MKIILPVSVVLAMMGGTLAARAEMKLPDLKKQPSAQAVLDEHFAALNACDWNRLLAQYPEDAQINLPNGTIVKGRAALGDLESLIGTVRNVGYRFNVYEEENERLTAIGS